MANRWGLQEIYCPKIIKRRQEKKNNPSQKCSKLRKGRKRCVKNCVARRELNKTDEFCTKKEKRKWGQKWRWNTRNCGSLKSRNDQRRCKKDKKIQRRLKVCVSKKMKSGKYSGEKSAWLSCFNKK